MPYHLIAIILLAIQAQPPGFRNPNLPGGNGQTPPGQPGPAQPGQPVPPNGTGQNQNVLVDGTYQILAYEKFGQILPGMNTLKVAIRNNILIFPGDGKVPGKMIQLTFGQNNSVTLTPLDGRTPPVNQAGTSTPGTGVPPINNSQTPPPGTDPGKIGQAAGASNANTIRQATGTPPVNNGQGTTNNQGPGAMQPASGADNTNMPGSESGVYVLSTEFFSIAVVSQPNQGGPINNGQTPPINNGNQTPPINNNQNQPNNNNGNQFRDPAPSSAWWPTGGPFWPTASCSSAQTPGKLVSRRETPAKIQAPGCAREGNGVHQELIGYVPDESNHPRIIEIVEKAFWELLCTRPYYQPRLRLPKNSPLD